MCAVLVHATFDNVYLDNQVFNNTWWGSSAESAIVIADARHIDEMDVTKMFLLRNEVHGNQGGSIAVSVQG